MALIIQNTLTVPVSIDDLGLEVPMSGTFDLSEEPATIVSNSTDLDLLINNGSIEVLDPCDDITPLSITESLAAVHAHNNSPYENKDVNRLQTFYVNKHGSDVGSNDGLTPKKAFLTFGKAITEANLLSPTSSNKFNIICDDAGIYVENLTVPSFIYINAVSASLQGIIIITDDAEVQLKCIETTGNAVLKNTGSGTARVSIDIMVLTGTGNGFINLGTNSILYAEAKQIFIQNGFAIAELALGNGNMYIDIGAIYITGTGSGILKLNPSFITGSIGLIHNDGGTGTGINCSGGTISLDIDSINTTTSVNHSGGVINLIAGSLIGTKSITANAIETNIIENNSLRWKFIDNNDSPYTAERLDKLSIDTTASTITINLDVLAIAQDGDSFEYIDAVGNFATNNVTFNPNTATINGVAGNFVESTDNIKGVFVFIDSENDWRLIRTDVSTGGGDPDQNLWETITADIGNTTANTITDNLTVAGGTDISTTIVGDTLTVDFTGALGDLDQNLWETITADTGNTTANLITDTLTVAGGTNISTTIVGDTLTVDFTGALGDPDQNLWETITADTGNTTANTITDNLTIAGGTDISTTIVGDILTVDFTGALGDPDQNLWETITADTGSTTANLITDTLTVAGGTNISTTIVGDVLTVDFTGSLGDPDQNLWETITADTGNTTANTITDNLNIIGDGSLITTSISGDTLTISSLLSNNDLPSLQIRRSTTLLGIPLTFTDLTFDVTDFENAPSIIEHNNTNTDDIDLKEAGLYLIHYHLEVDDEFFAQVRVNDTTVIPGSTSHVGDPADAFEPCLQAANVFLYNATVNDKITLQIQSSTTGEDLQANATIVVVRLKGLKGDTGAVGSGSITVQEDDVTITGGPHDTVNFEGPISLTDNGSGKVTVNVDTPQLALTTINGQQIITHIDATRANKVLSVDTVVFSYNEADVSNNDWIRIGNASDTDLGHIIPMNGTIVYTSGFTENANGNSKDLNLFVNTTNVGSIGTLSGAGNQSFSNNNMNIDINQGDRLRIRGNATGGTIQDTTVTLFVKWRG